MHLTCHSHGITFFIVPPQWVIEPRDSNVTQGKTAILDCQADGFPLPNITWKRRMGKKRLFVIIKCFIT